MAASAAGIALGVAFAPTASHAQAARLTGEVFNDLNGNGILQGSEPGLAGWMVDLFDRSHALVANTSTDASGNYVIPLPGMAAYTLVDVAPAGWVGTLPVGNSYAIPANATQNMSGLNFGNFQLVSVSGSIYDDLNGNGQQNSGEFGLAGRTAEVVDSSNNVVASATSDGSGDFTVQGVGPGSFRLQVVTLTGETVTQPTSPDYYSLATTSGVNIQGDIFGLSGVALAQVPEPASLTLLAVGLVSLAMVLRLRRA
jgi:hypothetical protein